MERRTHSTPNVDSFVQGNTVLTPDDIREHSINHARRERLMFNSMVQQGLTSRSIISALRTRPGSSTAGSPRV